MILKIIFNKEPFPKTTRAKLTRQTDARKRRAGIRVRYRSCTPITQELKEQHLPGPETWKTRKSMGNKTSYSWNDMANAVTGLLVLIVSLSLLWDLYTTSTSRSDDEEPSHYGDPYAKSSF